MSDIAYSVLSTTVLRAPSPRLVRLALDSEYRAWRNEYVLVREEIAAFPGCEPGAVLHVQGSVYLRERGLGGDVLDSKPSSSIRAGEALISVAGAGDERNAIERKVMRAVDWYKAELEAAAHSQAALAGRKLIEEAIMKVRGRTIKLETGDVRLLRTFLDKRGTRLAICA